MIKEQSQTWAKISAQIGVFFSRFSFSPNFYTWATILPAFIGFFAIVSGYIFTGISLFIFSTLYDCKKLGRQKPDNY